MNEIIEAPMNEVMDAQNVADDAAWAAINTPLSVEELALFCQDIERLFRINPMLEFNEWDTLSDNQYRMVVKNTSQEEPFEVATKIKVERKANEITLSYSMV